MHVYIYIYMCVYIYINIYIYIYIYIRVDGYGQERGWIPGRPPRSEPCLSGGLELRVWEGLRVEG